MSIEIENLFDPNTFTFTYIVYDSNTKDCLVIDPVLDFDAASGAISFESLEKVKTYISENSLKLHTVLETHIHADHMSSAHYLKQWKPEAKIAINKRVVEVQETFKPMYQIDAIPEDGTPFDQLLSDGDTLSAGSLEVQVIATPGHTPACTSFLIGNSVFTGDALFLPDMGTGRCDFPKGSAKELYSSIKRLYELDDSTHVYVGHDYGPGGREIQYKTTIGKEKSSNIHLKSHTTEEEFVSFRTERDKQLSTPKLLLPSLQVNLRAGQLPDPEKKEARFLKIPLQIKS